MNISSNENPKLWITTLSKYRDPRTFRSIWVCINTIVPFAILWWIAIQLLSVNVLFSTMISVPIGFFTMRLFCIQHDCGHYALFKDRRTNVWVGRIVSVFTLTPFAMWQHMHDQHHAGTGNLDFREMGEVKTLTVEEFLSLSRTKQMFYKIYRSKVFLLLVAPFFLFFIQHRLPFGLWSHTRFWKSALLLNLTLVSAAIIVSNTIGFVAIWAIFVPSVLIGATAGIYTFYVQHQFEDTYWQRSKKWNVHEASLNGASYVTMPKWLSWFTANISIHHVHHLYSRIPFYRLPEVLADYPLLAETNRISLRESLATLNFHLWDEAQNKMVSFRDLKNRKLIHLKTSGGVHSECLK